MMNTKRVWLDSYTANINPVLVLDTVKHLISWGCTIVVSTPAVDTKIFQDNLNWFEENVKAGNIIIELWNELDDMVKKPFHWSSIGITTAPAESFEDAIEALPNAQALLEIALLLDEFGRPKGSWHANAYEPPAPLSDSSAEILGINPKSNRTTVLEAAEAADRMDLFHYYNAEHVSSLAKQHCCTAIINEDGSIDFIVPYAEEVPSPKVDLSLDEDESE